MTLRSTAWSTIGSRSVGCRRAQRRDVGAVGIVALLLERRVVEAPVQRSRIDADRRDPLPVAVVVGDVAVEQIAHEVLLAPAPVDVQVLDQKARRDQPRAVVHPARRGQLAHAGVDHRDSPFGPRARRRSARPTPSHWMASSTGLERVADVARVLPQDVGVEVAPRELAGVGAARAPLQLARADAAEVQVGREQRRVMGEQLARVRRRARDPTPACACAPPSPPPARSGRPRRRAACGMSPTRRPDGTGSSRGAPWSRRGSSSARAGTARRRVRLSCRSRR